MPTNVLSRNTWIRNGGLTTLLPVLSLFVELGSVSVELGDVVALRAPAVRVVGGLGVGDISGRPLLLLSALLYASFFGFRLGGLGSVAHVRPQYDV